MKNHRLRRLMVIGLVGFMWVNIAQGGASSLREESGKVTLLPSVATLALSINCQLSSECTEKQNAALVGNPRQIVIQNTGTVKATNVSVLEKHFPFGTRISSNTCAGTINAGDSCTITVTPGSVASIDANNKSCTSGTLPLASRVIVTSDESLSANVDIYVLGYGCQYQGGFLYSVNDDYSKNPATGSIGGKVASLVDQAEPFINNRRPKTKSMIWSSSGTGSESEDADTTTILGIGESSTSSAPFPVSPRYPDGTPLFTACNGKISGSCNSDNIVSYYNFNRSSGEIAPTPLAYYAAGLCKETISNYSDWYLPAICELDALYNNVACPSGTQSIVESLFFLIGNIDASKPETSCAPPSGTNCLAGIYWSSTEAKLSPQYVAWSEYIDLKLNGQFWGRKSERYGVRCSRMLTS